MTLVLERLLPTGAKAPTTANGVLRASSIGALRKSSRERRDWSGWATREAADRALTPFTAPVDVEVTHLRPNRNGWPDVGASFFLAKAMLDGLVRAEVLVDDAPEYVRSMTFAAPVVVGRHGVRLTLTPTHNHPEEIPA